MHGTSNALEGDICINYAGAEFYSKDDYQKTLGGAYILVPLTPEYRDTKGYCRGNWNEIETKKVHDVICAFINKYAESNGGISKKAILGNSSGVSMTLRVTYDFPDFFNVVISMGAPEIPSPELF